MMSKFFNVGTIVGVVIGYFFAGGLIARILGMFGAGA
jgi:hypothetical protein